ncbi:hypothetical protein [Marinicella meishanensis]|uniref:hypothetical protein n=1 Tax=Marinicella meishanensis TaxID=2873263 RepID=UPI001CC177AB|nr:hypothetical protein [Marinicella sp. NBU2979]
MLLSRILLASLIILFKAIPIHAYELEELMASPRFAADQISADGIQTALNDFRPQASFLASSGHRKPHVIHDLQQFASFWQETMRPHCSRLINTYGAAMRESDFNDEAFLNLYNQFRDAFNDPALKRCEEFKTSIEIYLKEVGGNRSLPAMFNRYQSALDSLVAGSVLTNSKAFSEQSSDRYTERMNNQATIQTHLMWLQAYQPDHPKLLLWQQQFEDLNMNYETIANSLAAEMLPKSSLPLDYHADDYPDEAAAGQALRQQIAAQFEQQFGQEASQVILRDGGLKPARRFIIVDNLPQLQTYQAIPVVVVVRVNENLMSTHRGWFELFNSDHSRVVLSDRQNNFQAPNTDQMVRFHPENISSDWVPPTQIRLPQLRQKEPMDADLKGAPNAMKVRSTTYYVGLVFTVMVSLCLLFALLFFIIKPKASQPTNPSLSSVSDWYKLVVLIAPHACLVLLLSGLVQLISGLIHMSLANILWALMLFVTGVLLVPEVRLPEPLNRPTFRRIKEHLQNWLLRLPKLSTIKYSLSMMALLFSGYMIWAL